MQANNCEEEAPACKLVTANLFLVKPVQSLHGLHEHKCLLMDFLALCTSGHMIVIPVTIFRNLGLCVSICV